MLCCLNQCFGGCSVGEQHKLERQLGQAAAKWEEEMHQTVDLHAVEVERKRGEGGVEDGGMEVKVKRIDELQ